MTLEIQSKEYFFIYSLYPANRMQYPHLYLPDADQHVQAHAAPDRPLHRRNCSALRLLFHRSFNRDFLDLTGMPPRDYRQSEKPDRMTNYRTPLVNEILLKQWESPEFTGYPQQNIIQ
ncbi:MAG: hypothetical protein LUG93_06170 [Lachnospiraceae bacterium]|nr:hypothetical protein [Lachnospiraceae bacterium]